MTLKEYKEKISEINRAANIEKQKLASAYALERNKYKIGDTIEDHIGKIIFSKISCYIQSFDGEPKNLYFGVECRKDGKPKKNGHMRYVYESNLIK